MNHATDMLGSDPITLFLCGDVMTGRGIDQILPHPSNPRLHEPYVQSALGYVELAEAVNGPLTRPVSFSYIWGDALNVFERVRPDVKVVNLETAVTRSDDYWRAKDIHYRMHPDNVPCLTAAGIDCCVLANNHVLDWGYAGLEETLETLRKANLKTAGVGRTSEEAAAPAVLNVSEKGRVIVFAFGSVTSGVPWDWAAATKRPGVALLRDYSEKTVEAIAARVRAIKRSGDIVVASIHWGSNWGYQISEPERRFAHRLIDTAAIDLVHGHSSHHPRGIEVYRDRPVIYGCGDFLNDYEGIGGYEEYRPQLALMYFVTMNPHTGLLISLEMIATRVQRFRVNLASNGEAQWLGGVLSREGRPFGTRVQWQADGRLVLQWQQPGGQRAEHASIAI